MKTIGDKIRELRIAKNMTQQELAEAIKTSSKAVSLYENNKRGIDIDTIEKIASALDVAPQYLTGWIKNKNETQEDIGSAFDDILELLDDEDSIAFYGDITKLNQEQREILKSAIKHAIDMTNTMVNRENND